MAYLIHEFIAESALRTPQAEALVHDGQRLSYEELADSVVSVAQAVLRFGLGRGERVAVFLEKRVETVAALFGASAAGGAFVPVNPLLKPQQVIYILKDCAVRVLVTSGERLAQLAPFLRQGTELRAVLLVDPLAKLPDLPGVTIFPWDRVGEAAGPLMAHRAIDTDVAAILYTSGSTGKPKGVVLSHRNLITGAQSVAAYLENTAQDRILAVLPLSFDYGLSQLTTAFLVGATAVLLNYLLPRDILKEVKAERITGLAAVPPLWMQLAQFEWPGDVSLRYLTNSGGAMPPATRDRLRKALPNASIYLMYGLTEAFRSTYLPPAELARRPDSIGKAIPNAEILVLRPDGSVCAPGEPGELVHRGALVSMGYWNDPQKTAERFRPLDPLSTNRGGLPIPELAVWSGDIVRTDDEGFLYFIGRNDEMIKTSGYRVSPTEVEEVLFGMEEVAEAAAVGIPHPALGHAIAAIVTPREGMRIDVAALQALCRQTLPSYMVPARILVHDGGLPRNPNGKIDRKFLASQLQNTLVDARE
jgi:acyl-CoA ligase (AMP-forming) (exosortase A-associated)